MTPLEEQAAEAAESMYEQRGTWEDIARAVIGVLPKADVSDETISWWMPPCSDADKAEAVSDLRREVIDPMAAAHAAELHGTVTTEYHDRMMNQAGAACEVLRAERDLTLGTAQNLLARAEAAEAEVEALRAEVERLHSWTGLLELLDENFPDDVFPTLADDPARDTGPRLVSALRRAKTAEADRDRAVAEALEHAAQKIEADADGPYADESVPQRLTLITAAHIVRGLIPGGTE